MTVTDNLVVSGTGQSTSSTTGAVTVAGGAGVAAEGNSTSESVVAVGTSVSF